MTAALDYIEHVIITAEVLRLMPKVLVPYAFHDIYNLPRLSLVQQRFLGPSAS